MINEGLVSVIVPVYNTVEYLPRCVSSLINQSYDKLEILLIDDGSTDGSEKLCDVYASGDTKGKTVRVIHQKNQGVSAARNAGIEAAEGEWIIFADSDDTMTEDAIENLVRLCGEENTEAALGGYYGVGTKGYVRWSVIPGGVSVLKGMDMLKNTPQQIPYGLPVCLLSKRRLWDDIRFPVGKRFEDAWTMPHFYAKCPSIVTFPKAIYYYFEHDGSFMHKSFSAEKAKGRIDLFDHLAGFYKDLGLKEKQKSTSFLLVNHYRSFVKDGVEFDSEYEAVYKKHLKYCLSKPSKAQLKLVLRILRKR